MNQAKKIFFFSFFVSLLRSQYKFFAVYFSDASVKSSAKSIKMMGVLFQWRMVVCQSLEVIYEEEIPCIQGEKNDNLQRHLIHLLPVSVE